MGLFCHREAGFLVGDGVEHGKARRKHRFQQPYAEQVEIAEQDEVRLELPRLAIHGLGVGLLGRARSACNAW